MGRPQSEKKLQRVNVMLDRDELEAAQRKAAKSGIDPGIAGSTSAFVRHIINKFLKEE